MNALLLISAVLQLGLLILILTKLNRIQAPSDSDQIAKLTGELKSASDPLKAAVDADQTKGKANG